MKKTMLVTGATKNTGLAIARRFAVDGWNVALTSRDAASAEAAAADLKAEFPSVDVLGLGMDPANVADIRAAFAAVKERFGRLDAFVNNAAHLGAAFFGSQEAVKLMSDGGAIVFISSCHAKRTIPGRALYTASKAAIGGITRSLALELGCLGIRVNAILAGAIRTDRWDALSDEEVAARRARWPAGIESTPDDMAAMVAYLCSDAARTITGTEIPVDSGVGVSLLQYNKDWIKNDSNNAKYWEKK